MASASPSLEAVQVAVVSGIGEVLASVDPLQTLACIDIPIGLPDATSRLCDVEARRLLAPRRGSSVFPAPSRAALAGQDYAERCRLNRAACGKALSQQASHLIPKIREVDLAITPAMQAWIREAHPELAFAALAGAPLATRKATPDGVLERVALLQRAGVHLEPHSLRLGLGRSRVKPDDLLDAAVLLLTARRLRDGTARVLGGDVDSRGLRMEIVT